MKMKKIIFIILLLSITVVPNVYAHPGRTNSSGCHTCKTNCESWGLSYGEYHCHNGNSNSSSSSNNTNSSNTSTSNNTNSQTAKIVEIPKSSDNTLKSVTVDNKNITVADEMTYKTYNEKVDVTLEVNDSKAKYEIDNKDLIIGENIITITVTAENGNIKEYKLIVIREQLSNNTNIEVIINNEKVKFNKDKATISVSSDTEKIDYKYTLKDKNAKVKVKEIDELQTGSNEMLFKVTAQDGTKKTYIVTIEKETSTSVTILSLISGSIGCIILYFLIKKKVKH